MTVIHVEIAGRVQGIGFRWFVRERAMALRVRGWVRNLENGNVELAAAGADDAIRELLDLVRSGPPGALVRDVQELPPIPEVEQGTTFSILR